ncbi:hypothetical protein TNCV_1576551 [Trichonephila clavipes]|nr:hypothetical protein TNCV_1576551 [Trichonephila clavipes]
MEFFCSTDKSLKTNFTAALRMIVQNCLWRVCTDLNYFDSLSIVASKNAIYPVMVTAVAESRYRIVACLVTRSSDVSLKTRRVGERCMLNLYRGQTSPGWCGVVVRGGGVSSGVIHVT